MSVRSLTCSLRTACAITTSSLVISDKNLLLNSIKLIPFIEDEEIENNIAFQLIGKNRNELLEELLCSVFRNEIIILKGDSGQGKSFFAKHVVRRLYKSGYTVLFTNSFENNILSFTKEVIVELIGLDYFRFLEENETIITYLSEYFKLDRLISSKILELMRKDKFEESIPVEVCLEVLVKLMDDQNIRKKIVLIIDNLQKSSNDLFAFLKNLFLRLNKNSIPVLALSTYRTEDQVSIPENSWLQYLDTIIRSNKFSSFKIDPLDTEDVNEYIKALIPGAMPNLISFIASNTLKIPFYIRLYIDFLKDKNVIRSIDNNYWWLDDSSILIDSVNLRSNNIDVLITNTLERKLTNTLSRQIGIILFFYNNSIIHNELESIFKNIDPYKLIEFEIFHSTLKEEKLILSFSHDLYFYNLKYAVSNEELNIFASELLLHSRQHIHRADVLGKLYEYAGKYIQSQIEYRKFAQDQYNINPLRSLNYFEKSLDLVMKSSGALILFKESNSEILDLIFQILTLYEKYNFLSNRKAPVLFDLLQKHEDFNQLNVEKKLLYYYFLGMKYTNEENFKKAKEYFQKGYDLINLSNNIPLNILDKILVAYGINLKHLGEKDESLFFFKQAVKKWNSTPIQLGKYSNIAAYYLTTNPQISLENYLKMFTEFKQDENIHLLIDIAMANFYLGNFELSINQLDNAIPLSKKRINIVEESRAENILGVIHWLQGNSKIAESYLDIALSNGELANNHRWIWRIRTNLAQVAFLNKNEEKAYNISWAVIEHFLKTKDTLVIEAINKNILSRRFAALKAVSYIFYLLNKKDDLKKTEEMFSFNEFSIFLKEMYLHKSISFDSKDSNNFKVGYCILG